jgi:2-phosphosulfolactate phosphatase
VPTLHLHTLPQNVAAAELAGSTVIIVDQLRASTTIATALAAGAECVMPFAEIDETLAAAQAFGRANVLLGGERGGKRIPGFDLGNSPAEYTPERVAGRRILFTTTNGARALHHARGARRILVGATVNRTAVARAVQRAGDVAVLCAGTDGAIAREDRIAGGGIVEAILQCGVRWTLNQPAATALNDWEGLREAAQSGDKWGSLEDVLPGAMLRTEGGRNLMLIGQGDDISRCAMIDTLKVAPELDQHTNELRARHSP